MKDNSFRVWCKNNNEWEKDPCYLNQNGVVLQDIGPRVYTLQPCRDETHVVQFHIGRNDATGKKIYAGDIVRYVDTDGSIMIGEVVEFRHQWGLTNDKQFSAFSNQIQRVEIYEGNILRATGNHNKESNVFQVTMPNHMLMPEVYNYEIIGNIFENPELIK